MKDIIDPESTEPLMPAWADDDTDLKTLKMREFLSVTKEIVELALISKSEKKSDRKTLDLT